MTAMSITIFTLDTVVTCDRPILNLGHFRKFIYQYNMITAEFSPNLLTQQPIKIQIFQHNQIHSTARNKANHNGGISCYSNSRNIPFPSLMLNKFWLVSHLSGFHFLMWLDQLFILSQANSTMVLGTFSARIHTILICQNIRSKPVESFLMPLIISICEIRNSRPVLSKEAITADRECECSTAPASVKVS